MRFSISINTERKPNVIFHNKINRFIIQQYSVTVQGLAGLEKTDGVD